MSARLFLNSLPRDCNLLDIRAYTLTEVVAYAEMVSTEVDKNICTYSVREGEAAFHVISVDVKKDF